MKKVADLNKMTQEQQRMYWQEIKREAEHFHKTVDLSDLSPI